MRGWINTGNLAGPAGPVGPAGPAGLTGPAGPVGPMVPYRLLATDPTIFIPDRQALQLVTSLALDGRIDIDGMVVTD